MAPPAANEGRGRRGRRTSTSLAEINVVPLVDVMLVLLIIFMVAAPMMQRGIEVKLPRASQTQKMSKELTYVTVPLTFRKDQKVMIDDEFVAADLLAERLRQLMQGRDRKEVFLRGDGAVTLQELMDVFSRLKEGGIENVGMIAEQRERGR